MEQKKSHVIIRREMDFVRCVGGTERKHVRTGYKMSLTFVHISQSISRVRIESGNCIKWGFSEDKNVEAELFARQTSPESFCLRLPVVT